MTKKPLSIYVHIPYCVSKCKYCSFYSEIINEEQIDRYFKALKDTSLYFSKLINKKNYIIETVYFGGGTPTAVNDEILGDFLQYLKDIFNFAAGCEITIEANPKTVSQSKAEILQKAGFNRISLGVQTTSLDRLQLLGRIHSFDDSVEAYEIFKKAGFENISVDLMYALPNTDLSHVLDDLSNILALNPKHISTYALSLEEGTPLFSQKDLYAFPDDEKQLEMYLAICDELSKNGYSHYEISNFSKKGFESKHNLGYWERREYIGLGAGAHSFWDNKRFFSAENRELFINVAEKGDYISALGLNQATEMTDFDKREEEIMLSLRTSKGLRLSSLPSKMKKIVDSNLAKYENGYFSLTDKGFFVSNSIIYSLCEELLYDTE